MPKFDLDAVCDALAGRRRRAVCRYVATTDRDALALDELAGHVEPDVPDGDSRQRPGDDAEARTRLHHVGLPKLADADVIEYHPKRGIVTEGPALSLAADLIRAVEGVPKDRA